MLWSESQELQSLLYLSQLLFAFSTVGVKVDVCAHSGLYYVILTFFIKQSTQPLIVRVSNYLFLFIQLH